jgi:hypothetical protein
MPSSQYVKRMTGEEERKQKENKTKGKEKKATEIDSTHQCVVPPFQNLLRAMCM